MKSLVIIIAISYLAYCLYLYFFQGRMIYYPSKDVYASPDQYGFKYEEVTFKTSDGELLNGWYVPSDNAKYTVLFMHGNAGNITHRMESISIFNKLGLNVFIFDYRGYGKSTGSPSETGTYNDAEAAWEYLANEKNINDNEIIYFGRSLGGSVATWLATKHSPAALIVESVFSSTRKMARDLLPFMPTTFLVRYHYDSEENMKNIHCPVLVIHSKDDEIIPYKHGQTVYNAYTGPKKFLDIIGGHNGGFLMSGPLYTTGLKDFLDKYL
jgi:fermentation-respiration switch protein FrsA (DUF1100 family)